MPIGPTFTRHDPITMTKVRDEDMKQQNMSAINYEQIKTRHEKRSTSENNSNEVLRDDIDGQIVMY